MHGMERSGEQQTSEPECAGNRAYDISNYGIFVITLCCNIIIVRSQYNRQVSQSIWHPTEVDANSQCSWHPQDGAAGTTRSCRHPTARVEVLDHSLHLGGQFGSVGDVSVVEGR